MRHVGTCRGRGATVHSCGLPAERGLGGKECDCCCTCWGEEGCWSWRTDEARQEQYVDHQLVVQKWRLMVRGPSLKRKRKPPPNLESLQFLLCVICAGVSLPTGELQ